MCNYPECDGGYATGYCHPDCRPVLVPCETCQTEGRIYRGQDEIDRGRCPDCDGTGYALIDSKPIEVGDLDDAHGLIKSTPGSAAT